MSLTQDRQTTPSLQGRAGEGLSGHDSLGFVFPIYGWSLPDIVRTFIEQLEVLQYNGHYVYFVCTCGDDIGIADRHIVRALTNVGLRVNAGFSVVMPDSYVCLPSFDVDKDRVRHRKFAALGARIDKIVAAVREQREVMDVKNGALPHFKTNVLGWLFRRFLVTDKYFRTEGCIGCGKCAEVCPLQNIVVESQRPRWLGHCTGCLACYHHCPTRAIRFGRFTERKGQYLFGHHKAEINQQSEG